MLFYSKYNKKSVLYYINIEKQLHAMPKHLYKRTIEHEWSQPPSTNHSGLNRDQKVKRIPKDSKGFQKILKIIKTNFQNFGMSCIAIGEFGLMHCLVERPKKFNK
jgi:hypothetical protein